MVLAHVSTVLGNGALAMRRVGSNDAAVLSDSTNLVLLAAVVVLLVLTLAVAAVFTPDRPESHRHEEEVPR